MAGSKGAGANRSLSLLKVWRRYLAPSSDAFGPTMVKPGERGFGIIPWVMDIEACECGHSLGDLTRGDPVFAPAFVTWTSPMGTNDELRPEVVKSYEIERISPDTEWDMTTPMLHVESLVFPDRYDGFGLTVYKQGLEGWANGQDTSLVPAWAVTPITEGLYKTWSKQAEDHWHRRYPWLEMYATLASGIWGGDDYHFHNGNEACTDPEDPEYVEGVCQCGSQEAYEDMVKDFEEGVDFAEGITSEKGAFEDAYGTAMDRIRYGWKLCYERAVDGDETSGELGSYWSPYWYVDAHRMREKTKVA